MTSSNCSKVFETTELRDYIFGFVDRGSLAKCSWVCSSWTESALDLIWAEMNDMDPLFKILAPMIQQNISNNSHIIDERLVYDPASSTQRDWRRFIFYGNRIKSVRLSWSSIGRLSDSAVNEIARLRPTLSITPNLKTLSIFPGGVKKAATFDFALMLLQNSMAHISILIPPIPPVLSTFADHILLRVPNLESIELRVASRMAVNKFEDVLTKLLPGLKNLRNLRLPCYALTLQVIRGLSTNGKLERITFHDGPAHVVMPYMHLPTLKWDSAFTSLVELQISAHLPQLYIFFSRGHLGRTLTSLTIQVISLENAETLRLLLETLKRFLPLLCRLTVNGIPQLLDFDAFSHGKMLVFGATLKPVSDMKKLVKLCLSWPIPFRISNRELESLASALPRLENLSFNSCPADINDMSLLTLDILPVLSNLCPDLHSLALYVDCRIIPAFHASVFASGNIHRPVKPFTKLREIDFGLSPLGDDDQRLSILLSKFLPAGCEFKYCNPWLLGVEDVVKNTFGNLEENRWSGRYKHLETLVEPLISVRKDERCDAFARIRELEYRIQELEEFTKSSVCVTK